MNRTTDTATLFFGPWREQVHAELDDDAPDRALFSTRAIDGYYVKIECTAEEGKVRFVSATFRPESGTPEDFPGTRLFAQLRMAELERRIGDFIRRPFFQDRAPDPWRQVAMSAARLGRRAKPDAHYAMWAREYVEALEEDPDHPVPLIIAKHQERGDYVTRDQVQGNLNKARNRGLLTRAPKGKPGGELTAKARKVLEG